MSFTGKSLFTKPAWATKVSASPAYTADLSAQDPQSDPVEDAAPIFGQKHIYEDIVAQERRRRERHAMKSKERGLKDAYSTGEDGLLKKQRNSVNTGRAKRRRISKNNEKDEEESDATLERSEGSDESDSATKRTESSPVAMVSVKGTGKTRSKNKDSIVQKDPATARKSRQRKRKGDIDTANLDSDRDFSDYQEDNQKGSDGDPDVLVTGQRASQRNTRQQPVLEYESDEDDEFLRELKRSAREEAKLKKLGIGLHRMPSPSPVLQTTSIDAQVSGTQPALSPNLDDALSPQIDRRSTTVDPRSPITAEIASLAQNTQAFNDNNSSNKSSDDPEVQIFIKTMIPNAKTLIVNRRASQPLDKVREFWCQRNELHPKIASKVFFTWNDMRLFDSTTMRGIIEMLKRSHPTKDGSDPSGGKIMIEAVTEEIFEYRKNQRERRRKESEAESNGGSQIKNSTASTNATGTDQNDEDEDQAKTERSGPVIRLLCPGVEEISIRLRPHTSVAKIIKAFRGMRDIDPAKQCWLSYDGDRLEDEQTAEDIGFEDDDCVDVYLR